MMAIIIFDFDVFTLFVGVGGTSVTLWMLIVGYQAAASGQEFVIVKTLKRWADTALQLQLHIMTICVCSRGVPTRCILHMYAYYTIHRF